MSQRSIQVTSRGSMSSDTIVRSSSESEKKSREKDDEESVSFEKKPRLQFIESSSDTESDAPSTSAEKHSNSGRSLGEKIKNTWKVVKEKISDKSSHTSKTKKSTPCNFKTDNASLSKEERTKLWQENGRNLFGNIKTFTLDFKKSQDIITDLIMRNGENFAADAFNAEDYTGLGFDFTSTLSNDELINPMRIFGSKSVITSTKTTAEELLADSEDASPLPNYTLNKPIRLCASGIGPKCFSRQLLNILREIPLACPVILDVSSNNLGPAELQELVDLMAEHPVIYSLDLSNNPICPDEGTSLALMLLFKELGPVSRLFLNNTGFNNETSTFIDFSLRENFCLRNLDLRNNKLTERGIATLIYSIVPTDFFFRKNEDSALTRVQLQHNSPNDWDPIISALNVAFVFAQIGDQNFTPTSPAIPVQIDIPDSYLKGLSVGEPYVSEIISPQDNSVDDRL